MWSALWPTGYIVLHNGELVADGKPDDVIALPIVREIYLVFRRRMWHERYDPQPGGCSHRYRPVVRILHGISLQVPEGGVHVLLGRNGAGKTTTLRTIMGLWPARKGAIRFADADITGKHTSDIARLGIAYVPENMGIFGGLTVQENMRLATTNGQFDDSRLQHVFALFPAVEQFWGKAALVSLRWSEADAGNIARHHRAAPDDPDRRAHQGSRSGDHSQHDRDVPRRSPRTQRFCWWNRIFCSPAPSEKGSR